jgi:imidazolonepropionase-like amidohydrolase
VRAGGARRRCAQAVRPGGELGPVGALRTITSVAAGACGLGHRKGHVAPGFDADILAVNGDPIADPDALHDIRAVYARGLAVPDPGAGAAAP